MLKVDRINCFYGHVQVLRDFSLDLAPGEVLCLLGRNGAGKTTALKAIMGLISVRQGSIKFDNVELTSLPPHDVAKQGIGYTPQGRRLFSDLTVDENLKIGLMTRNRGAATRARVLDLFPILANRLQQRAGTLSGGEQQMLATARALCVEPKIMLLDEPTEGLMPLMINKILEIVGKLKEAGVATILVEQRVESALHVADRIAFIENGRSAEIVSPEQIHADPSLLHQYVGVGVRKAAR
ncbi:MAG: ABC transporter ATP-binding protein [Rhodospirillaceae bacterium]|nr:ABC transporter ATP-binding protein [Rhodospirillaceae bacterium]